MNRSKKPHIAPFLALSSLALISQASAITVSFDYSYDTGNFFSNVEAKASLEAARDFYTGLIDNSLNSITPGTVYNSGTEFEFSDTWTVDFTNPFTGNATSVNNLTLAADTILIYVGARDLGGSRLGAAGRGGYSSSGIEDFNTSVNRGNSSEQFSLWGGAAAFDSSGTDWHYNHTTDVEAGKTDFYSVALHELGHVFGLNASSDAWNDHWSTGGFTGSNALAAYNSDNGLSASSVPTEGTERHFADGTQSFIYGTTTLQEVALDPNNIDGERKLLTNVDVGALQDIGWQVIPEPSSSSLLALGGITLIMRRKRLV